MAKLTRYQVGQAGEHFVAAELHRRGANAVTFSGNMPKIDILASDTEQSRTITIQVKTKTAGSWHTSTEIGHATAEDPDETRFWVLVDIGKVVESPPSYYVVPEWWMFNHVKDENALYLEHHGGKRPISPASTHFAITEKNVARWRGCWDLLGVF